MFRTNWCNLCEEVVSINTWRSGNRSICDIISVFYTLGVLRWVEKGSDDRYVIGASLFNGFNIWFNSLLLFLPTLRPRVCTRGNQKSEKGEKVISNDWG